MASKKISSKAKKLREVVDPKAEKIKAILSKVVTVKCVASAPGQHKGLHVNEGTEFTWTGPLKKGKLPLWIEPLEEFEELDEDDVKEQVEAEFAAESKKAAAAAKKKADEEAKKKADEDKAAKEAAKLAAKEAAKLAAKKGADAIV